MADLEERSSERRARIALDNGALRELLQLPDDVRIVFVYADVDPTQVSVIVEGPGLSNLPAAGPMWQESMWPGGPHAGELAYLDVAEAPTITWVPVPRPPAPVIPIQRPPYPPGMSGTGA